MSDTTQSVLELSVLGLEPPAVYFTANYFFEGWKP